MLLAAVTASTAAEGVVAYNWARSSVDRQREDLFRAVAGSTVSLFYNRCRGKEASLSLFTAFSFSGIWLSVSGPSVFIVHHGFLHLSFTAKSTRQTETLQQ